MGAPKSNLQLWIDLAKWLITSVAIVVATMIIDYGFKDRQAGLNELKFYDKYVTELIVLNTNPVQKRMLAQYFVCIIPSQKLRDRWTIYYDSIYPEYAAYIKPFAEEDSMLFERKLVLMRSQDFTDSEQIELHNIDVRLKELGEILYPEMKLPEIEEVVRKDVE